MAATDYFEKLVLDKSLLGVNFSLSVYYLALFTADPTASGDLSNEVAAGDYTRKPVTLWTTTWTNATQIDWAEAVGDWGDVSHIGVMNSPIVGSGNMYFFEATSEVFDVNPGRPLTIPAGGFTVALD